MVSLVTRKIKVEERRWSSGEPNGTPTSQVRPGWKRQKKRLTKNRAEEEEEGQQTLGPNSSNF